MSKIAKIGNESNNNTIIQANNLIMTSSNSENFAILAKNGRYDIISQMLNQYVSDIERCHPLYPDYGVKVLQEEGFRKLVSFPLTKDAAKKFPKSIRGTVEISKELYPGFEPQKETLWDYSFRTQKRIKLDKDNYKEYLGDEEDPYPIIEDGAVCYIVPPEFPVARKLFVRSGLCVYETWIRRIPCEEYGHIVVSNDVDTERLFDITLRIENEMGSGPRVTFRRKPYNDVAKAIQCEEFLCKVYKNGIFSINMLYKDNEITLYSMSDFMKQSNDTSFWECAENNKELYVRIERVCNYFGISIDLKGGVSKEDCEHLAVIDNSIQGKHTLVAKESMYSIELSYEGISLFDGEEESNHFLLQSNGGSLSIKGYIFHFDRMEYNILNATICNKKRVMLDMVKRKDKIQVKMKPNKGKELCVYQTLYGIRVDKCDYTVSE